MAFNNVAILKNGIIRRDTEIVIRDSYMSIEELISKAISSDRRLLVYISGYSVSYTKKLMKKDYTINLTYSSYAPENIDDIFVDDAKNDLKMLVLKKLDTPFIAVTSDSKGFNKKVLEMISIIQQKCEGLQGYLSNISTFPSLSKDAVCDISYTYVMDVADLRKKQSHAKMAAINLWKNILGRNNVPDYVKAFLAFSFIQQDVEYDHKEFDRVARKENCINLDAHIAYGPLVKKTGICSGYAWSYKYLMDQAGIECQLVGGHFLKDTDNDVGHCWCLITLDGEKYHVDATYSSESGVYIKCFLKNDAEMRLTHKWDISEYPKASGKKYTYDDIEKYIYANERKLIIEGANEKYFFPDIVE